MSVPAGWSPATWIGGGGLALVAGLGAASSGVSGLFSLAGFYVFVVAVVALVRGRVRWARLRSRAAGGAALGVAIALAFVGGATADPQDPPPAATPSSVASPTSTPTATTASPSPTVPPSPSPSSTPTPTATMAPSSPATAAKGTALAAVARLTVKGRAPKTGYSREAFGQAWFDTDRNGCDTRNDILRRDLTHRS